MEQIIRIGMDTSKHIFQLHGVNAQEQPVLRKKLWRKEMMKFFEKLPSVTIAIEACGASHHWGRLLQSLGHEVKLIPPQLVKPYVKRGKNDAADAEALCSGRIGRATSRPDAGWGTRLANTIRGYAAEFGLTAAKGLAHLDRLLASVEEADANLPILACELFAN